DYRQTLRLRRGVEELAPLTDGNYLVAVAVDDEHGAADAREFADGVELVSGQPAHEARQPGHDRRGHVARRTQARFDDERAATLPRRDIHGRRRAERLAVGHHAFGRHAARAHDE